MSTYTRESDNIFRQANWLLANKSGRQMTKDELELVAAAMIPMIIHPAFSDIPIGEGLEILARIVDENHGGL